MSPVVDADLDWEQFSAAYFPRSKRHDLRALVAYGRYRRSRARHDTPPDTLERGTSASGGAALESWEDEGGRTS